MAYDRSMEGKSDRELLEELLGRARRTETRVTTVANHLGVDAGGDKPVLNRTARTLHVPTRKTSLDDILAAIGARDGAVGVYCGEDYLLTVNVPR